MVIKGRKRAAVIESDGSTSKTPTSKKAKTEGTSSVKSKGLKEEGGMAVNTLIRPKFIDWKFFGKKDMPFREWFEVQGWLSFLKIKEVMYVLLVKEFFSTLSVGKEDSFKVTLKGKSFTITLDVLSEAFGIPNRGAKIAKKSEIKKASDFQEDQFKKEICEGKRAGLLDVSSASLSTNFRVLHKFITAFIAPKSGSLDYVSSIELCLMWHIVKKRKFNLCYLIMNLLTNSSKSKSMPYAMLLTVLFDHIGVNLSKAVSTALKESDVIGQGFVSKTKKFKESKEIETTQFVDDEELASGEDKTEEKEKSEEASEKAVSSEEKEDSEEEEAESSEKEIFESAKGKDLALEVSDSINSEKTDSEDMETLQEALQKKRNQAIQIKATSTRIPKLPIRRKIVLTKHGVPKETAHRKKDSKTPSQELPSYNIDAIMETGKNTEEADIETKKDFEQTTLGVNTKGETSKTKKTVEAASTEANMDTSEAKARALLADKFQMFDRAARESLDLWLTEMKKELLNLMIPTAPIPALSPLKQVEKESKGTDVVRSISGADPETTEPLNIDSPISKAVQSSIPPSVSKRATRSSTKFETAKISPGEIGSKDKPAVLKD
ncbi:uncharacterized protein LOC126661683 [Mercurialis annua]|uniref:uncharacterized protein LOC126661683 n=1 Tax=Mercurialis annua TaxID=3986 RepID=UPI002160C311|nr:uncharacterized protein LOC126661683 [Mercurialis annua]